MIDLLAFAFAMAGLWCLLDLGVRASKAWDRRRLLRQQDRQYREALLRQQERWDDPEFAQEQQRK